MKKHLAIILMILGFQFVFSAPGNDETFTIYLIRHAEKDLTTNTADPQLTECGEQRADYINLFLKDVHLDAVYSTDYIRTNSTALPTANTKGLEINVYNPQELKAFSKQLMGCKQDALVVGHSNTTAVLAGLLVDEELKAFDLDIYNRIYQVVIYKNTGRLHLLHTSFKCND